jgi:NAD(P)H-dependent FMN reductase
VHTPGFNCAAIRDEYEAVMTDVKIGIIVGSTRPGRHARAVADWVLGQTSGRPGARYEIIDLADYPLPHLDEPMPPSYGEYQHDHTKAWASTIGGYDGFIFVTPEYNHSTSGVLKNAIDYLYAEWNNKAAAFVSYGSLGGARDRACARGVWRTADCHCSPAAVVLVVHGLQELRRVHPGSAAQRRRCHPVRPA